MGNSPELTAKDEYRTKVAARSEGTLQEGTHCAKKPDLYLWAKEGQGWEGFSKKVESSSWWEIDPSKGSIAYGLGVHKWLRGSEGG